MKSNPPSANKYSLGINCAHDAAACLVDESGIVVAIREERLSRRKHHEGFPERAIRYCLDACGADWPQVAAATINQYPKMECASDLIRMGYGGTIYVNPSHHLLHAYYARHVCGNQDALIVVVDGSGYNYGEYKRNESPMLGGACPDDDADEAESAFLLRDGRLELVHKRWALWESSTPYFRFPSLGHAYSMASQYVFQSLRGWTLAGKVMGLAPFGRLDSSVPTVASFRNGAIEVDVDWVLKLPAVQDLEAYWEDPVRQDVAARVQDDLESVLLEWLEQLQTAHGGERLCFTGGVAHNSVANGHISRSGHFNECVFPPAADDGGAALGAALYGYEKYAGEAPASTYRDDFHGRTYQADEIALAVSTDERVRSRRVEDVELFAAHAADRIAAGDCVALFDGKSEFSARALGHRSILCDPRGPGTKDRVNSRIKFREAFRPYAAMVLVDHVSEYFKPCGASPHMMVVADVLPNRLDEIPAVCHVDATSRIQTVEEDDTGLAPAILRAFFKRTGIPLLLNTSFNIRGEPIVETPQDALDCFVTTGLERLYMSPYVISKHPVSWRADDTRFLSYRAVLARGLRLEEQRDCDERFQNAPRRLARAPTGHAHRLSVLEYEILSRAALGATVADLLAIETPLGSDVLRAVRRLARIGVVSFGLPAEPVSIRSSPTPASSSALGRVRDETDL